MGAMDVSTLQSSELDAKRRLVRLQRQLLAARVAHSVQVTRDNNLAKAATARAEMDQLLSRDMAAAMSSEPPATEEQVVWLASVLHEKMHQLFSVVNNGVPTKVSWFRLFKHMDDDESGLISYTELADMVRNELNMSTHQLPEKTLKTVWLALDQDGSGRLTAGEFGAFMRLGEKPKERVNPLGGKTEDLAGWRERTMLANKRQSFAAKAEMDKLLDKGIAQSGIGKASQEEVKQLAARLYEKMHQLFAVVHNGVPSKVSWYRLFKHMDDDESGLISFVEFADMVRNELRLDDKELPEKQLKAAWLALDDDGSGRLTAGEFGAFMRIGEREKGRVHPLGGKVEEVDGWRERMLLANQRQSFALRAEKDKLLDRNIASSMAGEPPATDEELKALAEMLNVKMHQLFSVINNGIPTKVTWYRLFKHMDDDSSGLISYAELSDMVRGQLELSQVELPDRTLKAAWLALDNDGSGRLTAGEFGAFMRLGGKGRVHPLGGKAEEPVNWRARTLEANKRQSFALRAEKDTLLGHDVMASVRGEPRAADDEVRALAVQLHDKMHQLFSVVNNGVPTKVSWYRLFQHMDDDESGLIAFVEFSDMVRGQLQMTTRMLPDKTLKTVWRALDADNSGRLTAGEFGAFMRLGERDRAAVSEKAQQRRSLIEMHNRHTSMQMKAEMDAELSRDVNKSMANEPPATEAEVVALSEMLNVKMHQLFSVINNGIPTKVTWYRLFKHMDDDSSGLISFVELSDMVRGQLELTTRELPEKTLKAVWLALDQDGSGRLTGGEFGAFMRKGAGAQRSLVMESQARSRALSSPRAFAGETYDPLSHELRTNMRAREIAQSTRRYEEQSLRLERELALFYRRSGYRPGGGSQPMRPQSASAVRPARPQSAQPHRAQMPSEPALSSRTAAERRRPQSARAASRAPPSRQPAAAGGERRVFAGAAASRQAWGDGAARPQPPNRPASASAASPRRAAAMQQNAATGRPARPQSARPQSAGGSYQSTTVEPSLLQVKQLEAEGRFEEAATILKAKLDDLNARAPR